MRAQSEAETGKEAAEPSSKDQETNPEFARDFVHSKALVFFFFPDLGTSRKEGGSRSGTGDKRSQGVTVNNVHELGIDLCHVFFIRLTMMML